MKSRKSLNRIFWAMEYWFKSLKCQIWLTSTKTFFWESDAEIETLQKPSPYIWAFCKFVLKLRKSLNWIFWATEYWLKALKYRIWLTNTKPFSWKIGANFQSLQKLSGCIWDSHKFVLKSANKLNRIFWALEYWFQALKCQIWLMNTKPFVWESKANI